MIALSINGGVHELEVEPGTPLLWVLRETLGLTGTKHGCGIAACGACTVLVDGSPVRSCVTLVSAVAESFGSFVAQVAEVSIERGRVRVHRVVCAIGCGMIVNPGLIEAQMQSGIVYGLSAALKGEISISKGLCRTEQLPRLSAAAHG